MNYQVVSNKRHKNTKIKPDIAFESIEKLNNMSVLMQEFSRVGSEMPVIFIKHPQSGIFQAVAITGLLRGENLFVKDNAWQAQYLPASFGLYPFKIGRLPDTDSLGFFLDEDCTRLNETAGSALFNGDGTESKVLESYRLSMTQYQQDMVQSDTFIKALHDKDLIVHCGYSFDNKGEKETITGIYRVDLDKLNALSAIERQAFRDKGYMPYINAHIKSFTKFDVLTKLRA
ncbi:MAG: SapC family protein [Psychrosphaera sp.]|nr:SapC family protein [Psychrosphaera sp.]